MGTRSIYSRERRRAEVGYDLLEEYWENGYTTDVLEEIVSYGFDELGLVRIEATVDPKMLFLLEFLKRTVSNWRGRCLSFSSKGQNSVMSSSFVYNRTQIE